MSQQKSILVTGASGYVGAMVTQFLSTDSRELSNLVAMDIRSPNPVDRLVGVHYVERDIRAGGLADLLREHQIDTVVHLVALVGRGHTREFAHEVEVDGTINLVAACLESGVKRLILTSSGAAYGYHADNAPALTEDCELRGNEEFPYAHHKRLVEQFLAETREAHPELQQLIFRPGTILGRTTRNQITNLFEKRAVLGVGGSETPFVFIWDEDVAKCIVEGVHSEETGIFNMAGDGVMTLREIAARLGKPYVSAPPKLLQGALKFLKKRGLTEYGPEQLRFLQYRPVLSNERLKREFGYRPQKTTREVFEVYCQAHGR